jgi:hypothetical protein
MAEGTAASQGLPAAKGLVLFHERPPLGRRLVQPKRFVTFCGIVPTGVYGRQ